MEVAHFTINYSRLLFLATQLLLLYINIYCTHCSKIATKCMHAELNMLTIGGYIKINTMQFIVFIRKPVEKIA